jgi:hypothetical protein
MTATMLGLLIAGKLTSKAMASRSYTLTLKVEGEGNPFGPSPNDTPDEYPEVDREGELRDILRDRNATLAGVPVAVSVNGRTWHTLPR